MLKTPWALHPSYRMQDNLYIFLQHPTQDTATISVPESSCSLTVLVLYIIEMKLAATSSRCNTLID